VVEETAEPGKGESEPANPEIAAVVETEDKQPLAQSRHALARETCRENGWCQDAIDLRRWAANRSGIAQARRELHSGE
jgi:hypothetical protein